MRGTHVSVLLAQAFDVGVRRPPVEVGQVNLRGARKRRRPGERRQSLTCGARTGRRRPQAAHTLLADCAAACTDATLSSGASGGAALDGGGPGGGAGPGSGCACCGRGAGGPCCEACEGGCGGAPRGCSCSAAPPVCCRSACAQRRDLNTPAQRAVPLSAPGPHAAAAKRCLHLGRVAALRGAPALWLSRSGSASPGDPRHGVRAVRATVAKQPSALPGEGPLTRQGRIARGGARQRQPAEESRRAVQATATRWPAAAPWAAAPSQA